MADSHSARNIANAMLDYAADKEGYDAANKISTLSEIENDQVYTVKNSSGLGIIYNNPSNSNLWLGESSNATFSSAVNRFAENSMWLVIQYSSQYYLYNVGRRQFVKVPVFDVVSQPCTFQDEPFALEMTQQSGGFTFRESGSSAERGFMCAAPQNAAKPVAQWTIDDSGCQWMLVKVPGCNATGVLADAMESIIATGITSLNGQENAGYREGIYTLSGMKVNGQPSKGLYIVNGKKVVVK